MNFVFRFSNIYNFPSIGILTAFSTSFILAFCEKDIDTWLTKAWTAIDWLSVIWKSDLTDNMKHSSFQAAVMSILLYGCTRWTLTKRMEKKLYGNYTRMLRAILYKSWRKHPTKHQLYGHLPPIPKTIKVRRTRHEGHCWRSRNELISDVFLWPPLMVELERGNRFEPTYSSSVGIWDVTLRTHQKRRERIKDIRTCGTTRWWWWRWYIYICK